MYYMYRGNIIELQFNLRMLKIDVQLKEMNYSHAGKSKY